ncbi:hypothetical protein CUL28_001065 [Salmonella enterica subsp. enterica serovar Bovismorbificans]|uniref:hypothetical protein n=1 Tax=Salmonella enterica TaxID=28901 RepID=UPI00026956A6|nr:hypothetical protein [Salmonella enterica]EBX6374705.1 hypothetical protein [Salmonella enterica subsp. enterica serovar Newport]EDV3650311.1 hypothetical protein [Salmonella enterica subsp. enterica serovar Bovismorbificans]EGP1939338.1 hypothetical protein [Salmonella enterica]EGP2991993.1 hypothetical protein [Salmonella enterica]EJA85675.1 hypothetical protein SEEN470_12866 [Salmonella enterica subsp. enterica serovar Newport str. CVM 19470]
MLESFKELFSSTVSTAAQRVRNPAIGAFALSWCAFNWKSILYLLLSDTKVLDKITYISDNSTWKTVIGYPCVSVIIICGILPWANNLISVWQAKPLDNNDSIENFRKAKLILRATRLQRLQAKHDVTYEKVKTGAEKNIQDMKEEIIKSKNSMGELTAELKAKDEELRSSNAQLAELNLSIKQTTETLGKMNEAYKKLKSDFDEYKLKHPEQSQLKSLALGSGHTVSSFLEQHGLNRISTGEPNTSNNFGFLTGLSNYKDKDKD